MRSSLGCIASGEIADLVEEQRSSVRGRERALAITLRARERAALVAEQLALHERVARRAAVEDDERTVLARSLLVERAGGELFARAALSAEEHGRVGLRDALEHGEGLAHRDAAATKLSEVAGFGGAEG